ncbi:hypothetical protein DCO56_07710 [Sphingobacterium athyrii]|uniref:Uncharacterized protein n=1 Tax=Sphingobacterium athyrii TaxID=2152717 RepID=A0A363NVM8_9SPHI|nr:hypothetical protein DCO56_07710 [Sphingobacterium athyrii]
MLAFANAKVYSGLLVGNYLVASLSYFLIAQIRRPRYNYPEEKGEESPEVIVPLFIKVIY